MDNWQEEIGLLEAKDHITFLQDSLSTLSSMSAELTEQIDRLKVHLATAQDERDAALYAKVQTEEVVEVQRAEMTARTAAFQVQFVTLQDSLDAALNSRAQVELEVTNLRADLAKVRAQSEKAMAERASEIESSLAALRSADETANQMRADLAAATARSAELDSLLQQQERASHVQLQNSELQRSSLRSELTASTAWQAKVPRLAQLGQTLARLPGYKAAAADAAISADCVPAVRAAVQDLATVPGIGAAYEQRLYDAGVGTYWELAHLSDEDFVRMLRLGDRQQKAIDLDATRSEARRLAVETGAVGALWEGEAPDDFEPIPGIGKVFEQRLYDAGIHSYRALAAATVEDLAAICQANTPVAPDFAAWIAQAATLFAQRKQQRENAS